MIVHRKFTIWVLAFALALPLLSSTRPAAATPTQQTTPADLITYQVTLNNLTAGQPFSGLVAVTHNEQVRLLDINAAVSQELAVLAQTGNPTPIFDLLAAGVTGVTQALTISQPVSPRDTQTSTIAFTIAAAPGDFLSLAAMLVCTNDGLVGLDSGALPDPGEERELPLGAYDAGWEENTESSADLPDECSTLGPVALTGDPNGNVNDATVLTTPPGVLIEHPGITGSGGLLANLHSWTEVATLTISQVEDATPRPITGTNGVTGTTPITPTNPTSVTVTTLGTPTDILTGTLSDDILALMDEVTADEPTAEMQAVLDELAALAAPPLVDQSARNARNLPTAGDAVTALLASRGESTAPEPVGTISHRVIPGPSEDGTLLRILTPEGDGPFPVVVYFHGGGWVIAGIDAYEASARALTNAANSIVVMVAYRQSPEVRYPTAAEDAYAAFQWVLENAAEINGDPTRVAVAGESAGGNLATVVALFARDRGTTPPVYQVLVYPVTQLVSTNTPSYATYADAVPLGRAALPWFAIRYFPDLGALGDPYVSPLLMEDLSGLPPVTLITAAIDPLQSEGAAYAQRLEEAGVPVVYQNFAGVTHEFFGMGAVLPEARDAVALAAAGLQTAFGITATATLTDTSAITETEALTDTETLTGAETLTGTEEITETESITATGSTGGEEVTVVNVSLVEWTIDMPTELPAGSITFNVSNDGQRLHNFEIEGQGVAAMLEADLAAGEAGTLTVDLAPGEYTVYCPLGNHARQGMELALTVTE